jgi:SMC interacting uncharacterized protein involved in chromosome segregation
MAADIDMYAVVSDIAHIKEAMNNIKEKQTDIKNDMTRFIAKLDQLERQQSDFKATLAKYSVGFALVFSVVGMIIKRFLGF